MAPLARVAAVLATCSLVAACGDKDAPERKVPVAVIKVDGSSTVLPITHGVVRRYAELAPSARIETTASGTSGGFEKLCAGEVAMIGASRPILPAEVKACQERGVAFVELPVGFDGIAVVVHPSNDFAASMTVEELRRVWAPAAQGAVMKWSDVREGWPDRPIKLYGPDAASGTFDYFTAAIVGKERESRLDYTASEDDDALVAGVAGDPDALGYFGFAYYAKDPSKLRLVAVDDALAPNGEGPVTPGPSTILDGSYAPLSRPLFVYVTTASLTHKPMDLFVEYYLDHAGAAAAEAGLVALPENIVALSRRRLRQRQTGSAFDTAGVEIGLTVADLLTAETATVYATP